MTQLPTRPFTALPPPPDGIAQAVRTGRRMRLRRRLTVTGAGLAVAGAVAAAAAFGPASTGATDQLVPADRPSTTPVSQPVAIAPDPARSGAVTSAPPAPATLGAGGAGPAAAGTDARQTSSGDGQPDSARTATAAQPGSYRTPDLVRSYRTSPPAAGPNPRVCSGAVSGGRSGVDASTNWCMTAKAAVTGRGHDLSIEVCRDSTAQSQLSFSRRLEVDLVVLSGTRTVWRWSTGHGDAQQAHALDVAADACWTWTARWTDVDGGGRALPAGDYTLSVSSSASELRGYDERDATFSIR